MDRKMLINARHSEEFRIAIAENNLLTELETETSAGGKLKGNIYKAKITRIEPSLQAAFIDIGTTRNGFLQVNDIHPAFFQGTNSRGEDSRGDRRRSSIQDLLSPGQELVVQVVKEERELKGATLTTYLSLPGRYVVLMPGSDRGGISRKISDVEQRRRLKHLTKELELPVGMGIIIRTAGLDRSLSELSRDLSLQLKLWESIVTISQSARCPALLYQESSLATRVIRDYFTPEIREIITDNEKIFHEVREFIGQVMPRYRSRVKLYDHTDPLFSHYGIETQVSDTLKREVKLKGGGSIVIDPLEALVAIDVNSSRATTGENIEETAFQTNLEAAEEIGRQLRLRDLGGLIVIDFIDMVDRKNNAAIERKVRELAEQDKARIEVGKLSKFGLLEMSRQRLRASLSSQTHAKCSSCNGSGYIRIPDLVALEALRKIQSAVIVGGVKLVKARLNPSAALFLLNNKRNEIVSLESIHGARILILPDGRLKGDEFEFEFEGGIKKEEIINSTISRNQNESKRPNEKSSTNQRRDTLKRSSRLRLKKSSEERIISQEEEAKVNKTDEQQNNVDIINKRPNIESL